MAFDNITATEINREYIQQTDINMLCEFDNPRTIMVAIAIASNIAQGPLLDTDFNPLDTSNRKLFVNMARREYEFFDGEYFYTIPIATVAGQDNRVFRRDPEFEKDLENKEVPFFSVFLRNNAYSFYSILKNYVAQRKRTGYQMKFEWTDGGYAYLNRCDQMDIIHDVLSQFSAES